MEPTLTSPTPTLEMYTPADAADLLGVTRRTVYTWIRTGKLPARKIGPRCWHIRPEDLIPKGASK